MAKKIIALTLLAVTVCATVAFARSWTGYYQCTRCGATSKATNGTPFPGVCSGNNNGPHVWQMYDKKWD